MNRKILLPVVILMTACVLAGPVSAYSVEELNVQILPDGSATITAGYSLNWGEYLAYSLIMDREKIAEEAIEGALKEDVKVNYITGNRASVTVLSFAKVEVNDGVTSYTTPGLPYNRISDYSGKVLDGYPLLSSFVVNADAATPGKTVITFPDGYSVIYSKPYPGGVVPPETH